jgi:hypothetical protein
MSLAQRHLNLSISQRTVLVTVDMVRACKGVDADTITAQVDAGTLRWVWDVSNGAGAVRELRFWAKEIIVPEFCTALNPAQAINQILGSDRARWRGVEIAQLLLVSRPHIFRLHEAKELKGDVIGGTLYVNRPVLEKFLTVRLVNFNQSKP